MARSMTTSGPTLMTPPWAGDFLDRNALLPGGAKVVAAAFPLTNGRRYIPSGTVVGRTLVERDAGTGFGPAADTDEEIFLVAFDVDNADDINDVELYRPGRVVKENFLPDIGTLSAAVLAAIRDRYVCTRGAN